MRSTFAEEVKVMYLISATNGTMMVKTTTSILGASPKRSSAPSQQSVVRTAAWACKVPADWPCAMRPSLDSEIWGILVVCSYFCSD